MIQATDDLAHLPLLVNPRVRPPLPRHAPVIRDNRLDAATPFLKEFVSSTPPPPPR